MKKILAVVLLCLVGCKSQTYRDGTSVTMGLYVPTAEGLVGLQFLEYLNGCSVSVSSNKSFTVDRDACSTNTYFGLVNTVESSRTRISVK